MITGSIAIECDRRLSNLYMESHAWLIREAKKITKNKEEAEDLVQELFEYLHTKQNPKLWWGTTSYNLFYCNKFLHSRFMNKVRKLNRTTYVEVMPDREDDIPYDEERDLLLEKAHEQIVTELKQLSITKQWPQAKIFELYWMSPDTLDEVSNKIGISKSTTFLAVKKIRKYLEGVIQNPFQ
jgi:RNA polymerase sigma factor (sigma-70 family)